MTVIVLFKATPVALLAGSTDFTVGGTVSSLNAYKSPFTSAVEAVATYNVPSEPITGTADVLIP